MRRINMKVPMKKCLATTLVVVIMSVLMIVSEHVVLASSTPDIPDYFKKLQSREVKSLQSIEWVQVGPGSQGGADSTIFHPTDPDYVYISQNMKKNYYSTDGMESFDTWKSNSSDDSRGYRYNLAQTYQMDFSRQDETFGLAVNILGLWKTTDKGASWERASLDVFPEPDTVSLSAVCFDPTDDNIIYVGSGSFWKNIDSRTKKNPYKSIDGLKVTGTIWKSIDKGKTWQVSNSGIHPEAEIGQIFVHPNKPSKVYAATSRGFYFSNNGGESWILRNNGLDNGILRDVAMYYNKTKNKIIFYAVELTMWEDDGHKGVLSSGGVYKSINEGKNWVSVNDKLSVDLNAIGDEEMLTGGYGFYKIMAKWFGITQTEAEERFDVPTAILPSFREVEINPTNPNMIYIVNCGRKENSFGPEGVWISEDGGANWFVSTRPGIGYTEDAYWRSQYSPEDVDLTTQNMEVGCEKYWSWLYALRYPMLAYQYLAISPDGKNLMVHAFKSRLLSRDNGRTWKQVDAIELEPDSDIWIGRGNSNVPGKHVLIQPKTNKPYFMAGETSFWTLSNKVHTIDTKSLPVKRLDRSNTLPCPAASAFHPHNKNILYAVGERLQHAGDFMKSTDAGATWEVLSHPIPMTVKHKVKSYTLKINKNKPDTMFFAVPKSVINDAGGGVNGSHMNDEDYGVYKTTDGGLNWTTMNKGLPEVADVNALAMDPERQNTLYAAVIRTTTANGGLFKSTNGGEQWSEVTLPAGIVSVNDVHVQGSGKIFVSCGTADGEQENGGVWSSDDKGVTWTKIFHMPYVIETFVDPNNDDRAVVHVGKASKIDSLNPGIYLTKNGGKKWTKINTGIGNPDKVSDVKFDLVDKKVLWCSVISSGFYRLALP